MTYFNVGQELNGSDVVVQVLDSAMSVPCALKCTTVDSHLTLDRHRQLVEVMQSDNLRPQWLPWRIVEVSPLALVHTEVDRVRYRCRWAWLWAANRISLFSRHLKEAALEQEAVKSRLSFDHRDHRREEAAASLLLHRP